MNCCSIPTDVLPSPHRFYRFQFDSSFVVDSVALNAVSLEDALEILKSTFSVDYLDFIRSIFVYD